MGLTFVVPDIQGIPDRIDSAIKAIDIIAGESDRTVVQLGDLVNLTERDQENDLYALQRAIDEGWIRLIGNHEVPAITPLLTFPFSGSYTDSVVAAQIADDFTDGHYKAAYAVGDTLITHAGVLEGRWSFGAYDDDGNQILPAILPRSSSAADAERIINDLVDNFTTEVREPLLESIPLIRGGRDSVGGIFWADFGEHVRQSALGQFGLANCYQIVGHTPNDNPVVGARLAVIDSGAKDSVTIAYTEDGQRWTYVNSRDVVKNAG